MVFGLNLEHFSFVICEKICIHVFRVHSYTLLLQVVFSLTRRLFSLVITRATCSCSGRYPIYIFCCSCGAFAGLNRKGMQSSHLHNGSNCISVIWDVSGATAATLLAMLCLWHLHPKHEVFFGFILLRLRAVPFRAVDVVF